jgi:Ca-activated chloride channel homolog
MGDVGSASASSESPVKAPVNSINFGAGSPSGDLAPALSAEDHAHEAVAAEQLKESWGLNLPEPAPPALADAPLPPLAKTAVPTQGETDASKEPVSTFSLHVSDVSYRLAVAEVLAGRAPDPARIRQEEFYNAFDYGDPAPTLGEKVACRIEQSAHPYLQQRNLVRVALKVPAAGRGAGQPLQLTLLLDTSGSMEREDRAGAVRRGLEVLASLLGAEDRVNVVGFARESRLIAEQVAGDQLAGLLDTLKELPAEGGTDLEAALKLAGEVALRHFEEAAQNRIILITDGAANLGNARPEELATMVQALRQKRIALDACGVGVDELNDDVLEALTRKSDGRYYLLNSPDTADAAFARQVAGALRPAAEDVKVQVRFNPSRVKSYRLIGFEKHRLAEEDFRNDAVDAAELAADEAAVAMYEIEALPEGQGELGELYVRFRDASNGNMVERAWTLPYDARAEAFDRASPAMLLAGLAAVAADKLKGGAGAADLEEFTDELNRLRSHFADDPRVQEFVTFFERLSDLNP